MCFIDIHTHTEQCIAPCDVKLGCCSSRWWQALHGTARRAVTHKDTHNRHDGGGELEACSFTPH